MKSPESGGSARGRDSARGVSKRRGQRRRAMPVEEADKADGLAKQLEDVAFCERGTQLRRVKRGRLGEPRLVRLIEKKFFNYYSSYFFLSFLPNSLKSVEIHELLECRSGYATDVFQKSAKKYEFQEKAPESHCFSVIFTHAKFLHKSVDLVAESSEVRDRWVSALSHLIASCKAERVHFNENAWLIDQFRKADLNQNGKLSFDELWKLLKRLNLQISIDYAKAMFRDADRDGVKDSMLNEAEFLDFFQRLTERQDLQHVLRLFSKESTVYFTVQDLQTFLTEEQTFTDVDLRKAESIIDTYETAKQEDVKNKLMGVIGLRRLLQSGWGHIMKKGHENVFMDMNLPLSDYFCNSSHNTYLTGLQLKGEATVEGYINALRKGVRLLELDLFDGDHGEPIITHKRTLINPISLRNTLTAIKRCAFENSPFPVILTLENHVGLVQQRVMAELFVELLGDSLYRRPKDGGKNPLPSPNDLRNKFLLRGKRLPDDSEEGDNNDDDDDDDEATSPTTKKPAKAVSIDPRLSSLISLPSVKISSNIYGDIQTHLTDGSASVSEGKVQAYWDAGNAFIAYTAKRFVKSYPKGIRQDSSNMNPMTSWLCGVQSVAMNMQTAGDELDLNTALFSVNGNSGFVLKPEFLRKGQDPRSFTQPKLRIHIGIISGQYLPKPMPGSDIIDPFVSVEIVGAPQDAFKAKTRTISDNGFNPTFNDSFEKELCCPELAILRFIVKDFDSTSSNDFIGEFSIPVTSVRSGYSHVRLNTGYNHTVDPSASLLVRIAFDVL